MDPNQEQQPPVAPSTPDAPDQETMEQIRKRRLAKLGGAGVGAAAPTASSTAAAGSASTQKLETSDPSISTAGSSHVPENALSGQEQPTKQEMAAAGESRAAAAQAEGQSKTSSSDMGTSSTSSGSVHGMDPSSRVPRKRRATANSDNSPLGSATASSPRHPPKITRSNTPRPPIAEEPIEDWADRVLTSIFRVSVNPTRETDSYGVPVIFLPDAHHELRDAGLPYKLSADNLDTIILELGSRVSHHRSLFEHFLGCWKRVCRALKMLRGPAPQKEAILKEARRLCFSNCIFALTVPELFSRQLIPQFDTLTPYILGGPEHESGLCMDFFTEAVARLDEDDTIAPLFTKAMVDISSRLSTLSMNDDVKPYINAMLTYCRFPPLLNAVAQHPCFHMAQSAPGIEKNTILGPFFRISPLQPEVTTVYFTGPRTMDKPRIKTSQNALQMTLTAHQTNLKTIINSFIRASPQTRNRVLDWFAYIMNANHKRRAMQVDPREVSSDGFMINVTAVLDTLCEPFMDSTFSKVDRIDINYFKRNPRVNITDETKLNADQAESDAFYASKVAGESNFITEVFFLTLAAHHYGSEAANSKMRNLEKDIKFYLKNIATIEAERPKLANRPDQIRLLEETLKRHVAVLERAMALKFAIEGVLLDEKMQARSLQFMRYVTVWLLRVASQSDYTPGKILKLPLPASQPQAFSCLPEYALQDIVDNFKFVYRYIPQVILSAVGDEMIALCITFLESSEYIRNPYLKSSLVSLLFSGTWPTYHLKKGVLGDLMTNTKFANDYLLHAVMKFYIECESTGTHTQFYDKFNIRYEIFQVIKCIWSNDVYTQQLTQQSKSNRSFFVRFVNLLLNDATYVLDEGLSKFPKIHELQVKLRDPSLDAKDRDKLEEELKTAEGQAQSYMQLANETVSMMKLFTSTLREAFTMPEIVQRLAGMLDYNLDILTGPKSKTLKVDNPEKYYFSPKTLLPQIVDIYLNLGFDPAFVEAVAGDGRSYRAETMETTAYILKSKGLKHGPELQQWENLCKRFEKAKVDFDMMELDFGDAPPEFEDPIMGDLMKDPVILPSKHVVDRSTIIQHLLSDPKDPFTRQPMTIGDVVPENELREKIEQWKEGRRTEAAKQRATAAAAQQQADADAMDTT